VLRDQIVMWRTWFGQMSGNNSTKWNQGLCSIQFQKNNDLHWSIRQSPFEALFGRLYGAALPASVMASIQSEEDMKMLHH